METRALPAASSSTARDLNCTDEEAVMLLRNVKGYGKRPSLLRRLALRTEQVIQNNRLLGLTLGSLLWVIRATIWNSSAALFFGTIGYWVFGLLMIGSVQMSGSSTPFFETNIYLVDMFITNPMIMTAISFGMVVLGMGADNDDITLWTGPAAVVVALSVPIVYLATGLMGAILVITLPFAMSSTAPYDMTILYLFLLPGGYLAALKFSEEH